MKDCCFVLFLEANQTENNTKMTWYIHKKKIETHISFDPGVKNFAYSVTRNNAVIACGMLKHPMRKLTVAEFTLFKKEIRDLFNRYPPTSVAAERYMIRRFLSAFVETIGLMLGWMENECEKHGIQMDLFTAASWKLSIKKCLDLKTFYKDGNKIKKFYNEEKKKWEGIPPHILDTLCTTRYILNNKKFLPFDKKWLYENLPILKVDV